mmetsp:Transcript_27718/g.39363  ORF Transcript_27718/g.39363 Transcript_27718/m.39363 type:complete len:86 (+) Transcript_27718:1004-1261(+)
MLDCVTIRFVIHNKLDVVTLEEDTTNIQQLLPMPKMPIAIHQRSLQVLLMQSLPILIHHQRNFLPNLHMTKTSFSLKDFMRKNRT